MSSACPVARLLEIEIHRVEICFAVGCEKSESPGHDVIARMGVLAAEIEGKRRSA